MNTYLRNEIMRIMQGHKGRVNAMPRKDLLAHLQLFRPKLNDREMRDIYSTLPICTCEDGLFLPTSPEEVREFREYIKKAWGPIVAHRRVATIVSIYPKLDPSEWKQEELPL